MLHFLRFFFDEAGAPWYRAAVWGNVVAVVPCGIIGFLWSKTRFWPLNLLHAKLDEAVAHHRHTTMLLEEVHHLMHTGQEHPRVAARREAGEHPTPERSAGRLDGTP